MWGYQNIWLSGVGYVVYRAIFDLKKCTIREGATDHKVAVFVTECEAIEYCNFKNKQKDKQ